MIIKYLLNIEFSMRRVVYRQGDRGTNWYFILNGQVSLACSPSAAIVAASSAVATASPNHYVSFWFSLLTLIVAVGKVVP